MPPEAIGRTWDKIRLEIVVVAKVEVPVTARVPVNEPLPLTVNPAKLGLSEVLRFWLMLEFPETVRVLVFKLKVPLPELMVLPLKLLAVRAVAEVVAREDTPVTVALPLTKRAEAVRLVNVGEAMTAMVEVPERAIFNPAVSSKPISE